MDENPIFDSVVTDQGFNPGEAYVEPENPKFAILGYKARKRITGQANRVLKEAGLLNERPTVIETAAVRKELI